MASSRLKRKLELEGGDAGSSSSAESFVTYGTPLPALSKKDAGEFVPAWKQQVTDDQGRRRFHGAFTGGFSAGYYNSVGSKEGWTPATFKSSRSNRNGAPSGDSSMEERAQSFMDEEDLADLRASRQLITNDEIEPDAAGQAGATEDVGTLDGLFRAFNVDRDPDAPPLAVGILPGFVNPTAETAVATDAVPLPAQPPPDWTPAPAAIWAAAASLAKAERGAAMDADQRGALLGEEVPKPPEPPKKSVFEYLSARDRERLQNLSAAAKGTVPAEGAAAPVMLEVPKLDSSIAQAALKGFQPYGPSSTSPDAERHSRYTTFLQFRAGFLPGPDIPLARRKLADGSLQSIIDLNRELEDYARAAHVFKPASGMLAGRFTSGVNQVTGPQVKPGFYQPTASDKDAYGKDEAEEDEADPHRALETLLPGQAAARAGIFGSATRTREKFRPAQLLCKRFMVRNPYAGEEPEPEERPIHQQQPGSAARPSELLDMSTMLPGVGTPQKPAAASSSTDARAVATEVQDPTEEAQLERAPDDIFAAIFADSDDDDTQSEHEDVKEVELKPAPPKEQVASVVPPAEAVEEDIANFRPKFTPAPGTATPAASSEKKTKKRKRDAKKAVVSFEVEDDGDEPAETAFKPKKSLAKFKTEAAARPEAAPPELPPPFASAEEEKPRAGVRARAADMF